MLKESQTNKSSQKTFSVNHPSLAAVLASTMASHNNYPEFCAGCLDICGRGEIFKSSVLISAKEQRNLKCRLCRLLFSMSAFAQRLQIDPLRSYEIKILSLVGNIPIFGLDFTQYSDYHGFFALAKESELSLSPASFSIVEKYVDRAKGEKQGVFTMRLIRSISMQSRLPLLGLNEAQIAFNHMGKSVDDRQVRYLRLKAF